MTRMTRSHRCHRKPLECKTRSDALCSFAIFYNNTKEGIVQRRLFMLGFSGFLVILDQYTKFLIAGSRPRFEVIPGFFNLSYVENRGAAFGILQGKLFILSSVSLIAMGVLIFLLFYENSEKKGLLFGLALILGGTCGNFIDRVRLGYVIDFLDFHIKQYYWPSFNIADSAISVGVTILIIVMFWEEYARKGEEAETGNSEP